jgi:hypothetical protein
MRQSFIVPSIRGRDVSFLERSDIRSFEHLLQLLDLINYAFNVHPQQYSESALARHFALLARGISAALVDALSKLDLLNSSQNTYLVPLSRSPIPLQLLAPRIIPHSINRHSLG